MGMTRLSTLPGHTSSVAYAASADGSVVMGQSCGVAQSSCRAFRWTAATGLVSLGVLPGQSGSSATAVSSDGSVVAGGGCGAAVPTAPGWLQGAGLGADRIGTGITERGSERGGRSWAFVLPILTRRVSSQRPGAPARPPS
jgi:probable HAF family extracellular repeat protein